MNQIMARVKPSLTYSSNYYSFQCDNEKPDKFDMEKFKDLLTNGKYSECQKCVEDHFECFRSPKVESIDSANVLLYILDFEIMTTKDLEKKLPKLEGGTDADEIFDIFQTLIDERSGTFEKKFTPYQEKFTQDQDELNIILGIFIRVCIHEKLDDGLKIILDSVTKVGKIEIRLRDEKDKLSQHKKSLPLFCAANGYAEISEQLLDKLDLDSKEANGVLVECLKSERYIESEEKSEEEKPEEEQSAEKKLTVINYDKKLIGDLIKKLQFDSKFIEALNPTQFKNFLDSFVTESRVRTKTKVTVNYEFLNCPKSNVMDRIKIIAKHNELKDLILHPVLSTFIMKHSMRFNKFYLFNFLMFLIFFILPVIFSYLFENMRCFLLWFAIVFLSIRELFQLIMLRRKYFYTPSNYLELAMISFTSCGLWFYQRDELYRPFLSIVVILMTLELTLLLTTFVSSLSVFMFMLKRVALRFMTIFVIFILFILSFALCFQMIFAGAECEKDTEHFNTFPSYLVTFVKINVMLSGEYDAADLCYEDQYGRTLLAIFFILSAILLYNFINGLAITDVQALRKNAEFQKYKLLIDSIDEHGNLVDNLYSYSEWFAKCLSKIIKRKFQIISMTIDEINNKKDYKEMKFTLNYGDDHNKEEPLKYSNYFYKLFGVSIGNFSEQVWEELRSIIQDREYETSKKKLKRSLELLIEKARVWKR